MKQSSLPSARALVIGGGALALLITLWTLSSEQSLFFSSASQKLGVDGTGENAHQIIAPWEAFSKDHMDAGTCVTRKHWFTGPTYHCFPSLICIGAMKAGTFELKQWLEEHPQIKASSRELHFFGHGEDLTSSHLKAYVSGPPEWSLSEQEVNRGVTTFEKTPYYLASAVAAIEIHQMLPSVRLVALLRDPVARAYSSFYHHCERNSRLLQHDGAVVFNGDCALTEHCCCSELDNPKIKDTTPKLAKCNPQSFDNYLEHTELDARSPQLGTILRKGLYAKQLRSYLAHFDRDQLLVLDAASFARDPAKVVQGVFEFMGLPGHKYENALQNERGYWYLEGKQSKSNRQKPYKPMLSHSRETLVNFYAEPDKDLSELYPAVEFSWMKDR